MVIILRVSGELCELARRGDIEGLRVMLMAGCDPNACDYDKRTAMHLAAAEGNLHIVTELVSATVDVNTRDRWGGTPLGDAVREGHVRQPRSFEGSAQGSARADAARRLR